MTSGTGVSSHASEATRSGVQWHFQLYTHVSRGRRRMRVDARPTTRQIPWHSILQTKLNAIHGTCSPFETRIGEPSPDATVVAAQVLRRGSGSVPQVAPYWINGPLAQTQSTARVC